MPGGQNRIETAVQQRKLAAVPERWASGFENNLSKLIGIPKDAIALLERRRDRSLAPKDQAAAVPTPDGARQRDDA